MWNYEKRLQFPVNIKTPNAKAAQVILSQYGGPYLSNLEVFLIGTYGITDMRLLNPWQNIDVQKRIENRAAFVNINNDSLEFYWIPQFVFRVTQSSKGNIYDEINIHTIPLPIQIEGCGIAEEFFFVKNMCYAGHESPLWKEVITSNELSIRKL